MTPGTLFRANALYFDAADPKGRSVTPPGVLDGPLISQFLLRDAPYGAQWIGAQIRTTVPASEFMTEYEEWLAIQNGAAPKRQMQFDATPRYIATGRDVAEYIHSGPALGWAAALILATPGGGTDPHYSGMYPPAQAVSYPSNPYSQSKTQGPAGATFGLPYMQAVLARGSVTPPARPTGRSISCTGQCGRKPMAVWRTTASPMASATTRCMMTS